MATKKILMKAAATKIDLPGLIKKLTANTDASRMQKVTKMLRADRFQLFAEVTGDHLTGVVKSQTDGDLVYACRLGKGGEFFCCTQNLKHCGGLRGALCKHLLVLIIGLAQSGELAPELAHAWSLNSRRNKPVLDADAATATFVRYKGAQAGEVDWRPTETIPEDYYAL
ncbi:MAG: hypothetical protein Q8L48_03160 [Archangium sp.]|nr:hypothetical protein [Archangium sp.]